MKVLNLFCKYQKGKPPTNVNSLNLIKRLGIEGDVHAQWGSTRQLLIVSRQTVEDFAIAEGDLGENLLIDGEIEQYTSGQILKIGENVLIRLTFRCEPCQNLEKIQPGLIKKIKSRRGFLGMVVEGGEVRRADKITDLPYQLSFLPDEPKGRFNELVSRIPKGKVINTSDLLLGLGLQQGYSRAVASWIKSAGKDIPVHRIVRNDGTLFTKHLQHQEIFLREEGINIQSGFLFYPDCAWDRRDFHLLQLPSLEPNLT